MVLHRETVSDLYEYQFVILALLPVVHPERAAKLFSHFRVDTPATWDIGSEVQMPYLLRALYGDPAIDEVYKRQAASQIHKIIQKKPLVNFAGSVDYHHALGYGMELDLLVLQNIGGRQFPVSRKFFQDEVIFLLGVDTGRPIFHSWPITAEATQLIVDSVIAHQLLRRQFLPLDSDNSILRLPDSPADVERAAPILLAVSPEDEELTESIQFHLSRIAQKDRLDSGKPRDETDAAMIGRMSAL